MIGSWPGLADSQWGSEGYEPHGNRSLRQLPGKTFDSPPERKIPLGKPEPDKDIGPKDAAEIVSEQ